MVILFKLSVFPAEKKVIKIGILLPGDSLESSNIIAGANAAIEEFNKREGFELQTLTKAHSNQWGQEADEAVEMLFKDGACGLIAPSSGTVSHLLFQVAGRTRMPSVSLCSDLSVTGATIPWCLRIAPTTVEEIDAVVKILRLKGCSISNCVLFAPTGRAGREIEADVERAAKLNSLSVKRVVQIDPAKNMDTNAVRKALQSRIDCALIWLPHSSAIQVMEELNNTKFHGTIVVSSRLLSNDFVRQSAKLSNMVCVATVLLEDIYGNQSEVMLDNMSPAKQSYISILAHDAVLLLAEHLSTCDELHPHIGFPPRNGVHGWTGDMIFSKNGDRITKLLVWKVEEGKLVKIRE
ncbi:MAG: ABC transporter substrate-binding protein [Verrucomicrobiae bacterium]|nr:ABC transporter substrate-binding protein [Verrucomicrobiae bacterium]